MGESASVVGAMAPWANEFAEWRAREARQTENLPEDDPEPLEDVNTLEETKGCAIIDSGTAVLCSSAAPT